MGESPPSLQEAAGVRRHPGRVLSGWAIRLLIAFIISWLLLLACFVSGAISH
jgi:hypothetical protein